jgi:uncharacterized protein (DUF305 family)
MSVFSKFHRLVPAFVGSALAVVVFCSPALAQLELDFNSDYRDAEYYDANFLARMLDHDAVTIAMAELGEGRAVHAELVAWCADMTATQNGESSQMQTWLSQWYGEQHQPVLNAESQQNIATLTGLAGEEFEVMFLRLMIAHQLAALKWSVPCTHHADHAELADACENLQAQQSARVVQMRTWLCDWYGICAPNDQTAGVTTTWSAMKAYYR